MSECHALMQGSQRHGRSPSPKSTRILGAGMARPGRGSPSATSPSQAAARSARTPSFIPLSLTSPSNRIRGESIKARLAGGERGAQDRAREMRGREITLLLPAASGRGSGGGCRGAGDASSTRHQAAKWLLASLCPRRTWVPTSCPHGEGRDWPSWAQTFYFHRHRLEGERLPPPPPPLPPRLVGPGIPSQPKAPLAKMSVANPRSLQSWWHTGDVDGGPGDMRGGSSVRVAPPCPCSHIHPSHRPLHLPPQRPAAFLTPSGSDALPSLDVTTTGMTEREEEQRAAPLRPFYHQVRTHESSW